MAFSYVNRFCMGLLYGRAGRLNTKNAGPGRRPWYTNAKDRWDELQLKLALSPVYVFDAGFGAAVLGITATGSIVQDGVFKGVYAADYMLSSVSVALRQVAFAEGSWTGEGDTACRGLG